MDGDHLTSSAEHKAPAGASPPYIRSTPRAYPDFSGDSRSCAPGLHPQGLHSRMASPGTRRPAGTHTARSGTLGRLPLVCSSTPTPPAPRTSFVVGDMEVTTHGA
jgi:hypothetical protein